MATQMSQARVDSLRRLRSKSGSPSQPVEVCLPLGESAPANSSTLPNPSSLTLLFLHFIASVISASRSFNSRTKLKRQIFRFVVMNVEKIPRTQGLKYPLLVKRLACMIISGASTPETFDILQPATLSSGMILLMEKEYQLLRSTFEDAGFTDEQIAFLTKQWYIDVLARIRINSFRIELALGSYEDILLSAAASVDAEAAVGNAIYILPSFYNHDCDPNIHILWIESVNAKLKALRDIEAGEELRICYIDASMDHNARQAILSEGFGFHCKCARCMSTD
ncbi:histone-lysine N-methyltransferase ATXR4 isoform X2 [Nicotiana tabacum]|uniref:Histone-lysine N-methyltransferase ATXR4 isoform X2 n=2 Tax=Nicotiana TaxID=4085 RepID=A0A1S4A7L3_TOBAC|nr:PREDICTED: histone-lysine N-methyltransferase ATXR4 isoform X2 [Nicotiana sylvestris]XP_016472571.1 PREDICTED: histone-lysine N-methyltransferase ATXR4-like isoform X2 [Nicotiana tabacum]